VHGAVASHIRDGFDDAGEQTLKNISQPVRAFRLRTEIRRFVPPPDEDGESSAASMPDSTHSPAIVVPEPPGPKPFAPPVAPPTLLGRDDDLVALDLLLAQHRHVTVLGAGGIGKTSLALAVAHARRHAQRDGAAWVDLSSISEPALASLRRGGASTGAAGGERRPSAERARGRSEAARRAARARQRGASDR